MVATFAFWLSALVLETVLLVHLLLRQLARHHPFFFAYLAVVWIATVIQWMVYHLRAPYYAQVYWFGELLSVLAGFLVVWEIFHQTFLFFPAIRRRAGLSILFLVLVILAINALLGLSGTRWENLGYQLERWLRLLQAVLLAAIMFAARRYFLPLGRNVAGLLLGFGLFASLTVASVASLALTHIDLTRWGHLYAVTYLVTLVIWCIALWEYAPNRLPVRRDNLEQDYARLNAAITRALLQVRTGLRKSVGG